VGKPPNSSSYQGSADNYFALKSNSVMPHHSAFGLIVNFTFGLFDCVLYVGVFVIPGSLYWGSVPYFTVTLAKLKFIVGYNGSTLIENPSHYTKSKLKEGTDDETFTLIGSRKPRETISKSCHSFYFMF